MQTVSRSVTPARAILVFAAAIGVGGCAASGHVHVVGVSFRKIPTTGSLIERIDADRCYWWLDDGGRLCVAMSAERGSLFGESGPRPLALSMVLDEPPAGSGCDYRIGLNGLRMKASRDGEHGRWASLAGLVVVWWDGDGLLCGRFRISAKQQAFWIAMGGWTGNQRAFLVGEFRAVEDADRGRAVLEYTEEDGMSRNVSSRRSRVTRVE